MVQDGALNQNRYSDRLLGRCRKPIPHILARSVATHEGRVIIVLCRWDLQLNGIRVGLEAAPIRWHSHQGPDTEANGLSLCLLHHRLFDRGLWTLADDTRHVLVAQRDLSGQAATALSCEPSTRFEVVGLRIGLKRTGTRVVPRC